jgi:hypothetical protein
MKKQVFAFLFFLAALIIGLIVLINQKDENKNDREARNFKINNIETIDKIFLANTKGEKVLLKKNGSIWFVNETYVAKNNRINNLLKTAKGLEVKQRVPKTKQSRVLKNLATNNIKVEFFSKNQLIKTYFIGSADGHTTGTYMLLIDEDSGENYDTPFLTYLLGFEGYLTPRYEPSPSTWRDLKIFYFPKNAIQSVKLDFPESPKSSFEIKLQNGEYNLFHANKLVSKNSNMVKKYLLNFKSIAAERLLSENKKDSLIKSLKLKKPWFILSVTNLLGRTSEIIGYKKPMIKGSTNSIGLPIFFDPDRFYGICLNKELAILQHYVFQSIIIKKEMLK